MEVTFQKQKQEWFRHFTSSQHLRFGDFHNSQKSTLARVTHNSIIGQIANNNIFAKNVLRDQKIYIHLVEFLLHKINFGNQKKLAIKGKFCR